MSASLRMPGLIFLSCIYGCSGYRNSRSVLSQVACAGAETPLHHDEQENLFTQLRGRKQIVLFPSELYLELRPFPYGHPCDRQSMLDLPAACAAATPWATTLAPGEILSAEGASGL